MQGVTSKRKAIIAKDRQLLKMLTEASMRGHPPGKNNKKSKNKKKS